MRKLFSLIIAVNLAIFPKLSAQDLEPKVCFQERCFLVELAVTPQEREQGLMFRESLDRDKGMLFVFSQEAIHSFWMKNTHIALDIIWLNKEKEVVFIKENAQPCREDDCPVIHPDGTATYVLEVLAGTVKDIKIVIGDKVRF